MKNRYFSENDAHWSAQTRGYWVFQDYRFFCTHRISLVYKRLLVYIGISRQKVQIIPFSSKDS